MCAVIMPKSAAEVELSSTAAAAGQSSANRDLRQQTSTTVLATTDPNLLNHGSTAVTKGTTNCCGPVI